MRKDHGTITSRKLSGKKPAGSNVITGRKQKSADELKDI
jgi:hypothetical protein